MSLQNAPITFPRVSSGRPQRVVSPTTLATPGNVWPYPVPPNHAILASCGCVAQKPCVLVAPLPVFSNTQVTVSPFLMSMVTVCVFGFPLPVLPPLPVTVQLLGKFGSVEPPIPVRVHPSCVDSCDVYVPTSTVNVRLLPSPTVLPVSVKLVGQLVPGPL